MFSITFTHLTELLALGGRRSEALPFVRVDRHHVRCVKARTGLVGKEAVLAFLCETRDRTRPSSKLNR